MRANPVLSPMAVHFSAPPALLLALKDHTLFKAYSLGEDFASFPTLNLRGSDKYEQHITEGAFYFLFGYSVDDRSRIRSCILAAF